ncbi:hypothetical protein GCM10027610_126180 [Dactylosporangium cerinum]
MLDDPVDAGDHLRDVHGAAGRADLDRGQLRLGGDAAEAGGGVVADDDAGEMRAVAERVEVAQVGRLGLEREVRAVDDLRRGQAGHVDDAGVDERDADPAAVAAADL